MLHLEIPWFGKNGHYFIWDANVVGSLYADNANQTKVDSYTVSNVRINAFGSRYYEPAPERNVYGEIAVRRVFGR